MDKRWRLYCWICDKKRRRFCHLGVCVKCHSNYSYGVCFEGKPPSKHPGFSHYCGICNGKCLKKYGRKNVYSQ